MKNEDNRPPSERTFDWFILMIKTKRGKLIAVLILAALCLAISGFCIELGTYIAKENFEGGSVTSPSPEMGIGGFDYSLTDILPELALKGIIISSSDNKFTYDIFVKFPLDVRSYIHSYDYGSYIQPPFSYGIKCGGAKDIGTPDGSEATTTLFFEDTCDSPVNNFVMMAGE